MTKAYLQQQVGWMKCVACSDSKLRPGMMWIGGNNWIQCPECEGKAMVPRFKLMDPLSGREINQEGQRS
jgi:hypothetical protein